jgi:hypothetical protein
VPTSRIVAWPGDVGGAGVTAAPTPSLPPTRTSHETPDASKIASSWPVRSHSRSL